MACCGQPAVCSRTTSRKVADRLGVRSSLRFRPPPFFGVSPRRDLPPVPGPLVLAGSSCNQSRTAVRCTAARHDPAWLPPRQRIADDLFPIAADRTLSFVSLLPPGNSPPCMPLSFWRQLQCNCRAIIVASKRGSYFVGVPKILQREVDASIRECIAKAILVKWRFTTQDARRKLACLYPRVSP